MRGGCGAQLGQGLVMLVFVMIVLVLIVATVGEALGEWEFWNALEFDCEKINSGQVEKDDGLINPLAGGKTVRDW